MNEQRRKFLEEMDRAAEDLEMAQVRFFVRVNSATLAFAQAMRKEPEPEKRFENGFTVEPVVVSREEVEGGEDKVEPVTFGQSHTPTPEPAREREEEPPKKAKPVLTPEADALTVYTHLCETNKAGSRWSLETFRGSVRQALELGKIGEERFANILKAGATGGYWHKAMDAGKTMVVLGRRPPGQTETPKAPPLPAEKAGERLAGQVTDWEIELRELYESEGKAEGVINHIIGGFYYQAGCKEDHLHEQHHDAVSALEGILRNKVMELRERHENDAATRALSGVEA